jgi:hypothetical protein
MSAYRIIFSWHIKWYKQRYSGSTIFIKFKILYMPVKLFTVASEKVAFLFLEMFSHNFEASAVNAVNGAPTSKVHTTAILK